MGNTIGLTIAGKRYEVDADDLELGEIETIENAVDRAIEDVDFNRAGAIRALAYVLLHRENPAYTMGDALKMKIGNLGDVEAPPAEPPKPRPTRAKAKPKAAATG